ncbi:amidohydrolase family protein [Desulfovibrio inopinatus]|uniref:amidohydrolase family protein n=1 Tax=Desulfovibrio inopinatus TaxID=102109 RepID=UPI00041B3F67|nr:amidohydrolase family protein [Desulfovibrio inopinatus]
MTIDIHTHAFHPKIADKVLAQLHDHYGIAPVGTGKIDDLIARADTAGIDRVVVHSAATDPAQVIPANNWAIHLNQNESRTIAFGTMHPDFDDFEKEFNRLESHGVPGLKFHADFQGFRLDDPRLWPLFETIGSRFVLMFHVGDVLPPDENPSSPQKVMAIAHDFPDLCIIAAHFGGYRQWSWALEHLIGSDVYIDTSSSLSFVDDETLKAIFDKHPRERILFGSDYPLFDPGDEMKLLQQRMLLSDADLDQLLNNAEHLFAKAESVAA